MRSPLTGVLIGAGQRGSDSYTPYLLDHPEQARIVAVAEPDPSRRKAYGDRYAIPEEARFHDHSALFATPRLADFAVITTPDRMHAAAALMALERGYHVLLEKPMAVSEEDCEALARASEQTGRLLAVCHVLRHAPHFEAIKAVIDSGELGQIVTIQHSENVSYWHYAHSYCRGSWRNQADSSPMILAKSCHDLDLLTWFAGAPPSRLSSLQRPTILCEENAPEGAPDRCIEGCAHAQTCPYDAVAMYRDLTPLLLDVAQRSAPPEAPASPAEAMATPRAEGWTGWPVSVITHDTSREGVEHALRTSRYGRCVYRVGDNDQPASQNVDVLFANGVNASFTMHSTSYREGRVTRIDATRASLLAGFYNAEQHISIHDHKTGAARRLEVEQESGAHGGADPRLFRAFLAAVRGDASCTTSARESLWSHRMAFAADRAARTGEVVRWEHSLPRPGPRSR